MRRALAIDTSDWQAGLALVERSAPDHPPVTVADWSDRVEESHAAHLLEWIDRLLGEAGWSKSSLDLYVATRGPGRFTGIRIGLGTIRGLALATGRRCAGVSTLEALAEAHGPAAADRNPLLPAGRGQVYGARYDPVASPPRELVPPWLGAPERALDDVGVSGVVLFGAGTAELPPALCNRPGVSLSSTPSSIAAAAGRLALLADDPSRAEEPLSPLYLRPPHASEP